MEPEKKVTFGVLSQKHASYNAPLWARCDLLYAGGWRIQEHARDFIPRAPREPAHYYDWRIKATSYVNYFARLVGYLTGSLFNELLSVSVAADPKTDEAPTVPDAAFYSAFATDCDTKGTDFSQFVRAEALVKAMVKRRALVQVDLPLAKPLPDGASLAQEDASGNRRAYLVSIDIEELINWEKGPDGRFLWAVLQRKVYDRKSPLAKHDEYRFQFKIWEQVDGRAVYYVFQTKLVRSDEELNDEDELTLITPPRTTSFPVIPLVELELPEALWVGNQCGPLCQEHYRRRSDLIGALCRSLVEIPYVKLGPEIPEVHGALPSERAQDPSRGDNILLKAQQTTNVVLGSEDEIGFAGPSGKAFELASKEAKDVREEIFASVNAMALQLENSASALKRSGESKAEDKSAIGVILKFLADQTKEFAQQVMTLVSLARGEHVKWAASGLNTFDSQDRQEIIEDAALVQGLNIPSRRFQILSQQKVVRAVLPNATAKQLEEISREIEASTSEHEHGDQIEALMKRSR